MKRLTLTLLLIFILNMTTGCTNHSPGQDPLTTACANGSKGYYQIDKKTWSTWIVCSDSEKHLFLDSGYKGE